MAMEEVLTENPFVTSRLIEAMENNSKYFWYLPNFPFLVRVTEKKLIIFEYKKLSWRFIPYFVSIILLTAGTGVTSSFYVFLSYIYEIRFYSMVKTKLYQAMIGFAVVVVGLTECHGVLNLIWIPEIRMGYNATFELQLSCNQHNSQRRFEGHSRRKDPLGNFLVSAVVISATCPPIFAVACVITTLDPFYFVFEELLPSAYDRSFIVIIGAWIGRTVLTLIGVCEFMRYLSLMAICVVTMSAAIIASINDLNDITGDKCVDLYFQLRTLVRSMQLYLGHFALYSACIGQFGVVMLLWIGMRCWDLVPLFVSVCTILLAFYLVGGALIVLTVVGKILSDTEDLIRQKRLMYKNKWNRDSHYFYLQWKAQAPLTIPCGRFFNLEGGTRTSFLQSVIDNLMNVMILQPSTA